ncbi:hypothetical protein ACSXBA_15170 (plasmid) [Clostridium perfringens]|jgi:hypothetical protein|uniref:Uncharacterized protein n=1 Tax=Clostridium perfringens (strain 13 / Type A) TaxID=195102 RepID=Q93MC5_CLOPE|nr:hypothetical protein [Clostridium perfringens]MBI6039887.1 hypothetical protein [Clostridium perfringens]MDH2340672.1 hypothetical protein [Clostridium perfringens]MDM0695762.1 hypothetical protein [Clostridium perfringens]MDN4738279.1 hypothetical protein [Clostridium perfringens]MDN4738334.1 hypothetical protein [Clostridium perfringens]
MNMIDIFESGQKFKKILEEKNIDRAIIITKLEGEKNLLDTYIEICIENNINLNREIIEVLIYAKEYKTIVNIKKIFVLGLKGNEMIINKNDDLYRCIEEKVYLGN